MGLLAFVRLLFHTPYGQTEGFVRFLSGFVVDDGLQVPDYSTIKGRVNGLRVDLGDSLVKSNGSVSIAVDASGIESMSTTEGTGSGGHGR
jgi:hypothetical protein